MNLRRLIMLVPLMFWALPAFSQGCVMCYSSAKGAPHEGQQAIRRGIIVLLVPSVGFMSLGVWMACRYARNRDVEQTAPGSAAPTASSEPLR